MVYNSKTHCRRSIRLKDYDYGQPGAYFVTICTQGRQCLFGEIKGGRMIHNGAGDMISAVWYEIPQYYSGAGLDVFQIMPNHVHGILIVGAGPRACPIKGTAQGQPQGVAPADTVFMSLPEIVHRRKTMTTKKYTDGVKQYGWRPFNGRLWQRNYYEHVIRNDDDLNDIREYIINNPLRWADDPERIS